MAGRAARALPPPAGPSRRPRRRERGGGEGRSGAGGQPGCLAPAAAGGPGERVAEVIPSVLVAQTVEGVEPVLAGSLSPHNAAAADDGVRPSPAASAEQRRAARSGQPGAAPRSSPPDP